MATTLDPKLIKGQNPISNAIKTAINTATGTGVAGTLGVPAVQKTTIATAKPATVAGATPAINNNPGVVNDPKAYVFKTSTTPAVAPTTNPAPTTGALNYNTASPAQKSAMESNAQRLQTDSNYLASEIQRTQDKIAAQKAAGIADTGQDAYLTKLTGISAGVPLSQQNAMAGQSAVTNNYGLPSDLSWLGASADNEVARQIAAYQGQDAAAKLAAQYGVDTNNQYLAEQIKALQSQRAVAQDSLQQQQNRFGGLYSGGLNYQGGAIDNAYANQQGSLTRDIAARNQQLLDQYGTQANTIAQQIQSLQANQPGIIRDRIQDYLNQYANQYGYNPLNPNQSTLQGKQANLDAALQVGNQTGYNVSPQNDWQGLYRQTAQGTDAMGNPLTQNLAGQQFASNEDQRAIDNAYRTQQAQIDNAYQQGQLNLQQAQEARLSLQQDYDEAYRRYGIQNGGTGSGSENVGLTPNQVLDGVISAYGGVNAKGTKTGKIDPTRKGDAFLAIVDSGLNDAQTYQLLSVAGFTKKEIEDFKKQYPDEGNFSSPSLSSLGGALSGAGDLFTKYANKYGIEPELLAAISMHETGNGTSKMAKNKNNVGGMYNSKVKDFYTYGSLEEGIEAMARNLKKNYIDEGYKTIEQIQKKYSPVGAANDPNGLNKNWVGGVTKYYNQLKGK